MPKSRRVGTYFLFSKIYLMKKVFLFAMLIAGTLSAHAQSNNQNGRSGYPPPGCSERTTTSVNLGGSANANVRQSTGGGSFNGGVVRTTDRYCAPTPPPRQAPQPQRPAPRPMPIRNFR